MTHQDYIEQRDAIFSDDKWVLDDHKDWLQAIDNLVESVIDGEKGKTYQYTDQQDGFGIGMAHLLRDQRQTVRGHND